MAIYGPVVPDDSEMRVFDRGRLFKPFTLVSIFHINIQYLRIKN